MCDLLRMLFQGLECLLELVRGGERGHSSEVEVHVGRRQLCSLQAWKWQCLRGTRRRMKVAPRFPRIITKLWYPLLHRGQLPPGRGTISLARVILYTSMNIAGATSNMAPR